ncbi:unnamed protein product [Cercopithifilaria johnstoni]|uniref:Uncharacterized protein n=1 Tax=Cercopithifilaria johnstoni TaxID=2874296 RepID=A0A8J2MP07_9BILA|nr:unnamed protein product [Cercopithifilaria johnstoni]
MRSRCGIISTPSKKEAQKPWKATTPLRPFNQGIYRNCIRTKSSKSSGQHSSVSEKENRLDTQVLFY